jgi:hypothetical protein
MKSPDIEREVAGIIARLLMHYYAPGDLSDAARRAMAQDWLEDLAEFGPAIVADACRQWRRKPNSRRPLPGDIRALCLDEERERQERGAITQAIDMDAYARSVGFRDNAERMEAIREADSKCNTAAAGERLRAIREELSLRPAGNLRPAGTVAGEATAEELREARSALGLDPDSPAEAAE